MFQQRPLVTDAQIVETTLHGRRHYGTPAGVFPSVTTVLSMSDQTELLKWREEVGEKEADRITREAADRGTRLHKIMEEYLANDPEYDVMSWMTRELFYQIRPFVDKEIKCVHVQEAPLYSSKLRTAGRCDLIATLSDDVMTMCDFKNSRSVKSEDSQSVLNYKMQCSAYIVMANEVYGLNIRDFCIIVANLSDNYPTIIRGKAKDYIGGFIDLRKKYDMHVKNLTNS